MSTNISKKNNNSQIILSALLKTHGLPAPVSEHRFHSIRKWRFDYAWVEQKVALEVDGGVWISGRHNRASGYLKDVEKFNEAAALGWRVIKTTPQNLLKNETIILIKRCLDYGSSNY